MSAHTPSMSASELASLRDDGKRYELLEGELRVMSLAGGQHGRMAMRIGSMLEQHVHANRLGQVFASETGFLLSQSPDTVRAPDVAFLRQDRYQNLKETAGYLPIAPDLAIEVVSPSDSSTEVEDKAQAWLGFGCAAVLVVDPGTKSIRVYRDPKSIGVSRADGEVNVSDIVPGWSFSVSEVFED